MGGAAPVAGVAGQFGAFHRLPRGAARHRRRVPHPQIVEPGRALLSQQGGRRAQQRPRRLQPLVVAGLMRQIREHHPQVHQRVSDPPMLAVKAEQRPHHRQRHHHGTGQREIWFADERSNSREWLGGGGMAPSERHEFSRSRRRSRGPMPGA